MTSAYDAINPLKREEEKYGWSCIELNHFLLARVLDYHGRETGLTSDETQQRVDEQGVDYVVGVVASRYGVEQKTLRDLINKYQP